MTFVPKIQPLAEFEADTMAVLNGTAVPSPGPSYASQFGAIPYRDRHVPRARKHEWLIKNVLTRGEQGMLVGASQTGKSFLALDMAMAVARGVDWFGNKTRQGLVIYHAGESAKGVSDKRLPAYDRVNGLEQDVALPFVLLTLPLDLYASDDDTTKLIAECKYWSDVYPDFPLELLVIDTYASVTPGADENAGKDVSNIRRRCKRIEQILGCTILLVHHKNAAGNKPRGHTSMFADVENVMDVSMVQHTPAGAKEPVVLKDFRGRKVREAAITKLKDGEADRGFRFTLASVRLGEDEDGEAITSCVIEPPDMGDVEPDEHRKVTGPGARMPTRQRLLLNAIVAAVRTHGRPAPSDVPAPNGTQVVEWRHARDAFVAQWMGEERDEQTRLKAQSAAMKDAGEKLIEHGYIGRHNNWCWRTARRLPGEKARQAREAAEAQDEAEAFASEAFGAIEDSNSGWLGEAEVVE